MKKNNTRPKTHVVKPKRKVKHGSTPKRKRDDELLLITVNNYDKYQPYMDELKRRGITHENVGERLEEVKELRPLPAQCRKEGGECL